jgi:hypothetical protein
MSKSYLRRNSIAGQFAPRLIEMLESPAYKVLSRAAHRVLARIEIELAHHGGRDNGKLPVTFDDFVAYGVHRHMIAPAIRELVALGFIEITEQGHGGNAEFRTPSKYRITYRHLDRAEPTHEWRRITEDDAAMIAKGARRHGSNSARILGRRAPKTSGRFCQISVAESATETANSPVAESATTVPVADSATTIDISGWRVGDAAGSVLRHTPQPTSGNGPTPTPDPWADLDIPECLRRR